MYAIYFEELVATYKDLLFSGVGNNPIKTYKFARIPSKKFASMQDEVFYEELYFKMAEKYFATGKTPLSAPPKSLPEIRPPSHLDLSTALPSLSCLYSEFLNKPAKWMLTSFFIMQFFQEAIEKSGSSKLVITNALEEMLFDQRCK